MTPASRKRYATLLTYITPFQHTATRCYPGDRFRLESGAKALTPFKVVLGKSHGVPAGRAPRPQPRALILLPTADVTPATSSPSIPGRDRLAEVPSAALRPERPRSFISADRRRAPAGWVARHREVWSVVSVCFHRLGSSSKWSEAGRGCNAAPGSASCVDRHRDDHQSWRATTSSQRPSASRSRGAEWGAATAPLQPEYPAGSVRRFRVRLRPRN